MKLLPVIFCMLLTFACIFMRAGVMCAQKAQYNINITNGLQSNHIYNFRVDRYGYLWIATTKGVYKYNGYKLTHFGIHNGLASDDVWDLYEDKRGRMWLLSISPALGYIYKDHYKQITDTSAQSNYMILNPRSFVETKTGIAFLNQYKTRNYLFEEQNDTLRSTLINLSSVCMYVRDNGDFINYRNNSLSKVDMHDTTRQFLLCKKDNMPPSSLVGPYLIPFPYNSDSGLSVAVYDIRSCSYKYFNLETKENITMLYKYDSLIYITTNKNTYIFNSAMHLHAKYSFRELMGGDNKENSIVTMLEDHFWGRCMATYNKGVYIDYAATPFHSAGNFDLTDHTYIGAAADSQYFWWNNTNKFLVILKKDGSFYKGISQYQFADIRKIVPYDNNKSLVLAKNGLFWLYKNGMVKNFLDQYPKAMLVTAPGKNEKKLLSAIASTFTDAVFTSPNELFMFSYSNSLSYVRLYNDSISIMPVDNGRWPQLLLDTNRQQLVAFDHLQLLLYNYKNGEKILLHTKLLEEYGIKKIDNICIDRFENIYLKTYNKLIVYNPSVNYYGQLLRQYQMDDAVIHQSGDQLIVAARAGVVCCTITGPGKISLPKFYPNPKSIYYKIVTGLLLTGNNIILNTDKGTYTLPLPSGSVTASLQPEYKFIINLPDTTFAANRYDTISLGQPVSDLKFDVINPLGSGILKYMVKLKEEQTSWSELNANEFHLSNLVPGKYYTLSVIALDDAWKSSPIDINLYIRPYWYQSKSGKRWLWALFIFAGTGILTAVVYTTRKIVSRQHTKKNLALELKNLQLKLELKSIYSQINPHFIFNTLATGLYYIKKQQLREAYDHISSFSDLLRSYIRASRNRYTTIGEEIKNLENYMNLQLARFEDKFTYAIIVADSITPQTDKIPSLLLQPLVENAINHGLFHKEGKGRIDIEFKRDEKENAIICTIDDDGIGREQSKLLKSESSKKAGSYGTDLIADLINIFNKHESAKISLHYIDKRAPLTGTTVVITVIYI